VAGREYVERVAANHALAGGLALATILLATIGEILVLTHTAGATGLLLLPCGAAAGVGAWVALGSPRKRADIGR
jgi:hypothetical protein